MASSAANNLWCQLRKPERTPDDMARILITHHREELLIEAADFVRDAHFRDGMTVQEISTALRHMAGETGR